MKLESLKNRLPEQGLFNGKSWLFSPRPFELSKLQFRQLEGLGYILIQFQKACDQLYYQSLTGQSPKWISECLDRGKPEWMLKYSHEVKLRGILPQVTRPDLMLTEEGFGLTEIDSVPGGVGLLAWLNQTYEILGFPVIGGKEEMLKGFSELLPEGGDIWVSPRESGLSTRDAMVGRTT